MIELSAAQNAHGSSRIFRTILDAMAKPGHVLQFHPTDESPAPLSGNVAAIIQTLCDFQSAIWLGKGFANDGVQRFIKFHTGAPFTDVPAAAGFALLSANAAMPKLSEFAQGTHEYPDRSTTLIVQVDGFTNSDVGLSGPGLKAPASFGAKGLTPEFWRQMITNSQQYPLGVDAIFVSTDALACCPRSTRIQLKESG